MTQTLELRGGCLCGNIRYYGVTTQPASVCHCTHCQKQSGSAFSIVVGIRPDDLTLTGETIDYRDTADSGRTVMRRFCGACGSPILSEIEGSPLVFIKAGTLDDTSGLKPVANIWCRSAQSWIALDPTLPALPEGPRRA